MKERREKIEMLKRMEEMRKKCKEELEGKQRHIDNRVNGDCQKKMIISEDKEKVLCSIVRRGRLLVVQKLFQNHIQE